MDKKNTPVTTLRDGSLKASIWRNDSEKGSFHSCTLSRVYKDEKSGELRDSNSFSGKDMMRVSELARRGHNTIVKLNRELTQARARDGNAPAPDQGRARS